MMKYTMYSILFLILGCASTTSQVRPEKAKRRVAPSEEREEVQFQYRKLEEIQHLDLKEVFGSYMSQDAVWVEGHPLVVNREFDFSVAMSMPDIGAGLAARKRIDGNKQLAEQIQQMQPFGLREVFESALSDGQKNYPDPPNATIGLYGMLFGSDKARLQTILEIFDTSNQRSSVRRFIHVSEARKATGEKSWTENNGAVLISAIKEGVAELAALYILYGSAKHEIWTPPSDPFQVVKCPVGSNQKIKSVLIRERDGRALLHRHSDDWVLLSCGADEIE